MFMNGITLVNHRDIVEYWHKNFLEPHPEAVTMCPNGFLGVYYGKIDVKMEARKTPLNNKE